MRSFLFEDIWMLSRRDRRARRVEFHSGKNLILGRNHTGKSSLIKTLFTTLGARPEGELSQWDENTISKVGFSVDGHRFSVLHQTGTRALFDPEGRILASTGDHGEWSAAFADVTGFNLPLTDKQSRTVPADPKCFFLPFYINQDGSWQTDWNTFTGLAQFKAPIGSILEYFSGIKPPEYYEAKAKRDIEQQVLDNLRKERGFLEKARERVGKSFSMSGPKIEPENFKIDIEQLTTEVNSINKRQEILRDQAVKERELLSSIHLQSNLANEALSIYEGDSQFLRSEPREVLVCPVCNAEHSESFLDLLTYAEDARSLRDITVRLRKDAREIENKLSRTNTEIAALEQSYRKVAALLSTRRGDMQFSQVVESMGAEKAFRAFEDERVILETEMSGHLLEHERMTEAMSKLTDRNRSKEILKIFREAYSAALVELSLPMTDTGKAKLTSRPNLSGSGGPRSVLAYYAALWAACYGEKGSFRIPLVVDSPNQQGQDHINLPKVISFLSGRLPRGAQLILGSEIDTDIPFDRKIELTEQYKMLSESDFDEAEVALGPLVSAMYLKA
ncbi:MAG: hypothetical protein KJ787_13715 [Gammaproteobacteria bacterium]|nr:hypothetical protein [Gammaproteobacteria bacterium]MBU1647383.1 hypothetical protein [Gammaproteobacteria bacterium]MBU1973175.1 hypothetical protein [Gammaproteobacteria bacterium]